MKALTVLLFASFLILFSCKKDPNNPGNPNNPGGADTTWKLDSGVYNPNSYFPLRVGAYWIYERDNGQLDSVRCYGKAIAYNRGVASDTAFGLEQYEKPLNGGYSNSIKLGVFEGYAKLRAYKCQNDENEAFFWENYNVLNLQPRRFCSSWPGNSSYVGICMAVDTSLAGYQNVDVFREAYMDEFSKLEFENDSVNMGRWVVKEMALNTDASYQDRYYSKGVGCVRIVVYKNGNHDYTSNLIRYRIQ